MAKNVALEALQLGPRLDPELLDERPPGVLIHGERFGLASRAIQREHELPAEALTEGMGADERLELADEVSGRPGREVEIDPGLERNQTELLQAGDLALRERLVAKLGERRAAPERERLVEQLRGRRRVARRALVLRTPEQRLEAIPVEPPPGATCST